MPWATGKFSLEEPKSHVLLMCKKSLFNWERDSRCCIQSALICFVQDCGISITKKQEATKKPSLFLTQINNILRFTTLMETNRERQWKSFLAFYQHINSSYRTQLFRLVIDFQNVKYSICLISQVWHICMTAWLFSKSKWGLQWLKWVCFF